MAKVARKEQPRESTEATSKIVRDGMIDGLNKAAAELSDKHGGMNPNDLMNGIMWATEEVLTQMAYACNPAKAVEWRADFLRIVARELLIDANQMPDLSVLAQVDVLDGMARD